MEGEQEMFFKYVLLGMVLETLLIIIFKLIIKTTKNYKKYKELKEKDRRLLEKR